MSTQPDAYKILQVDHEAEDEVIVAAYRRLARKYHPDVAPGPEAAARMAAINAAWELIGEPAKRAAYDRERAVRAAMGTSGVGSAPPAPTGAARPAGSHAHTSRSSAGAGAAPRSGSGSATGPGPNSSSSSSSGSTARPASASHAGGGSSAGAPPGQSSAPRPPEPVSRDWTSGRSTSGGGYDASMRTADGTGAAGPAPGNPSGSVLNFGRYSGWSLGEIARTDLEYIEWLDRMPIGRPYREELDAILRRTGRRRSAPAEAADRRGLFRRR